MKISAIIIAKNEKNQIRECLGSLRFADEIILIDNGSIDGTASIAKSKGARIIRNETHDFSFLRNLGKEKAIHGWILYLDGDERISVELALEIKNAIKKTQHCAFMIPRVNYYLGHRWPQRESMLRLMKKEALLGWSGSLHETPLVTGKTGQLKYPIIHYTHENLTDMVDKTNIWSETESLLRLKNNHPPLNILRFIKVMIQAFGNSFIRQKGYLAGRVGIIESLYQMFSIFISYSKLWEKQNKRYL